ncbi:MAG: hypothetical protein ICV55_01540 [Coleofasciculus sp. C3-bin4]|jgi:hypothetical protein|nr:hypothetical protein [Coleofasciculus sp. Co-bin14]MBD0361466.1 hypothetical protein [Coleofasciculus sp. C3-bin4]
MFHDNSLTTSDRVVDQVQLTSNELAKSLRKFNLKHPALNRVRSQLLSSEGTETTITSYDRMHHRHSRS